MVSPKGPYLVSFYFVFTSISYFCYPNWVFPITVMLKTLKYTYYDTSEFHSSIDHVKSAYVEISFWLFNFLNYLIFLISFFHYKFKMIIIGTPDLFQSTKQLSILSLLVTLPLLLPPLSKNLVFSTICSLSLSI